MNVTTEVPTTLLGAVALIACGQREDKIRACETCVSKAPALLNIASTGALDALAAAICGGREGVCHGCQTKAEAILSKIAEVLCVA